MENTNLMHLPATLLAINETRRQRKCTVTHGATYIMELLQSLGGVLTPHPLDDFKNLQH